MKGILACSKTEYFTVLVDKILMIEYCTELRIFYSPAILS